MSPYNPQPLAPKKNQPNILRAMAFSAFACDASFACALASSPCSERERERERKEREREREREKERDVR
jgi:hypothetical protein